MVELVYVDEQPSEGRRIILSAVTSEYFSQNEVEYIEPSPNIDETIEEILW